jgi:hypothetical protein
MKRSTGAVALATAFLTILVFAVPPLEGGHEQPSVRVEETDLDLGTVVAGTVATATFVFHNDGPKDVHIIRAKPS